MIKVIDCSVTTHDYKHLIGKEVDIIDIDTFKLGMDEYEWRLVFYKNVPYIIAEKDLEYDDKILSSNTIMTIIVDYTGFNEYLS